MILKIKEVAVLNAELELLLTEPEVSFSTKYDLVKLLEKTRKINEAYMSTRIAIFKKYGKKLENEDAYTINGQEESVIAKAQDELSIIADKEENFTDSFKINEFADIKSKNPYFYIYKFIE